MRKLFEDLRARLEAFVAQRDDLLLVVRAGASEQIALLKTLEGLEQGAGADVYLLFSEQFTEQQPYVSAIVGAFAVRHQALIATLAQAGAAVPPAMPDTLLDTTQDPATRLRALLVFARGLIPELDGVRLVVALMPHAIADSRSFAGLVDALLEHTLPAPWCHHMRFIVREDPASPALMPSDAGRARTLWYAPDLGQTSVETALEAEANDATLSLPERMQALLILAGMDTAHQRVEQALEKYALLANYHSGMGDLPMLALAANGMGEACAQADRHDQARQHFERALTPALEAQDLPSLINITFNLARLHMGRCDWNEAIAYYIALSTLAHAALNASLQLICHEQHGACLHKLGLHEPALAQWQAGVTLAKGVAMPNQELSCLRRMHELLGELGRSAEQRECAQQMQALIAQGAQELPL
jgi:tetratricopeptide (TPR) repeat protein